MGYESCGATLVPSGSIILASRAPIGTLGIAKKDLCTNQGCKSLVLKKEVCNKFIFYILCVSTKQLNTLGRGTTFLELSVEELGGYEAPFPSLPEQKQIAAFLDRETAKIDTLIDKQKKLIALLKEKRQATISHAVTKGLNPNAPMKDSGIPWLGKIPKHWEVSKFNYEIDYLEGPGILAGDFHDEGIPLLRIQNVKGSFVSNNFKTYLALEKVTLKWEHFRVSLGDLIISCSASTGLISEVDQRTVGAIPYTGLIRLRPRSNRICKDYIRFLTQSDLFVEQINILKTGATIQHFGPFHLQQMYITLPPIEEQEIISNRLKQDLLKLDQLIETSKRGIELIQERRTALISAAVTGKIDVRDGSQINLLKLPCV